MLDAFYFHNVREDTQTKPVCNNYADVNFNPGLGVTK